MHIFLAVTAVCFTHACAEHIGVIGAGFSGLTAACELQQMGYQVTVFEKNGHIGGRAEQFTVDGFTFDAGPSWYWFPDLFDRIFSRFGRDRLEFYNITRLNPAYRVHLDDEIVDVPGTLQGVIDWATSRDPDNDLKSFFAQAKVKYDKGIFEWIWKPMTSVFELIDLNLIHAALTMNMFGSLEAHIGRYTSDSLVQMILKWPIIFIGASPADAPALYSLMTYGGHAGTFYPDGGMTAPVKALHQIACDLGVSFILNSEITSLDVGRNDEISKLCTKDECTDVDGVVAAADYFHVEQKLLPEHLRRYDENYWSSQALSPSCILFYLGFDTKIEGILHHNFFFDHSLDDHLHRVFIENSLSLNPTFYVSVTSKSDKNVAFLDGETVFVLVPVPFTANGTDTEEYRESLLKGILERMQRKIQTANGASLADSLVYKKTYGMKDFESNLNSFRGNAFGHANYLLQSLIFKPKMDSLSGNLVFAGHLTNPGPGVPPSMVSGIVAAKLLHSKLQPRGIVHKLFAGIVLFVLLVHLWMLFKIATSTRWRSYATCVRLLFKHGRTYFAASTLMSKRQFLDTAALYALFRVADDFVDTKNFDPKKRREDLENFISNFWACFETQNGNYALHPVLPAVIESVVRLGYSKKLFESFFHSMRMDIEENKCNTWQDTKIYMEGSAAIIGDFMVPILMSTSSDKERSAALTHARDLGNGFQLTNMIRDIGEDLDLHRQYIPGDVCNQYEVRLEDRNSDFSGFVSLLENMFDIADRFYASSDIGIQMLPIEIRPVIQVAQVLYHELHNEIRKHHYNVFADRIKVSYWKRFKLAISIIPISSVMKMMVADIYFRILFAFY